MHRDYQDLLALTDVSPKWYEASGVPRWCEFLDGLGVYWRLAALYRIECQSCRQIFTVGQEWAAGDLWYVEYNDRRVPLTAASYLAYADLPDKSSFWTPEELIPQLYCGDPPRHGCVGDTMSSEPLDVLGVWERKQFDAERLEQFDGMSLRETS